MPEIYSTIHVAPMSTHTLNIRCNYGLTNNTRIGKLQGSTGLLCVAAREANQGSNIKSQSRVFWCGLLPTLRTRLFYWIHQTKKASETWQSLKPVIRGA